MDEFEFISILRDFGEEEKQDIMRYIKLQRDLLNAGNMKGHMKKRTATESQQ